jgi:FkbM family methyltransferase
MNFFRKLLYSLLGKKLYFHTVSWSFLVLYKSGILKIFNKFKTHYLVRKLINKDDVIIDIGANFGYYTTIFARASGKKGLVFAVEPVPLYREILVSNTLKYSNVEITPFALSDSEGPSKMGIPSEMKYRHGLMRIIDTEPGNKDGNEYMVDTLLPESVFGDLKRLDYIKCDIEGHEDKVIPGFKKLIEKFNPIIQIELEKTNFELINSLLGSYGYIPYTASNKGIEKVEQYIETEHDLIYIPESRKSQLNNILDL